MLVFGAGLLLSNRTVRQYLGQIGVGRPRARPCPTLERYDEAAVHVSSRRHRERCRDVRYAIDQRASRFTAQRVRRRDAVGVRPQSDDRHPRSSGRSGVRSGRRRRVAHAYDRGRLAGSEDDCQRRDRREIDRIMHEEVLETSRYPEIVYRVPRSKCRRSPAAPAGIEVDAATASSPCTASPGASRSRRRS